MSITTIDVTAETMDATIEPKLVKRKSNKSKGGRPKLKLCAQDITDLASIGCTNADMACLLNCSADTIEKRFSGACNKGRSNLRNNIKKKQYNLAMEGNVVMLIWLGKQYCGQRDSRQEIDHTGEIPLIIKNFGTKDAKPWRKKK